MSAPRKHPIGQLLATAAETSRIMWRSYDAHLSLARRDAGWEEQRWVIYQRCVACDERLLQLWELRERGLGPKAEDETPVDAVLNTEDEG